MKKCTITIFEGPDGCGKTTAAQAFAKARGAKYVHFPALKNVTNVGLPRMYIEAMMPALLGYQNVVLDRCWISEYPYGTVFRGGELRVDKIDIMMLEMIASKCQALVVYCNPDYQTASTNFIRRSNEGGEMLESVRQYKKVYDLYCDIWHNTSLPIAQFDYTEDDINTLYMQRREVNTVGVDCSGKLTNDGIVFVGDFSEHQGDRDPFMTFPCVKFSHEVGNVGLFINELVQRGCNLNKACWMSLNEDLSMLYDIRPYAVIGIGQDAYEQLYRQRIMSTPIESIAELLRDPVKLNNVAKYLRQEQRYAKP